ncbi:hypothetical protein TRFO_11763 [Tritrichomonas foetus]|uniref:Peptidase C1A papain C-terminal domain-containing protein n=1 Tax=Tritrichomonas foetus TaxID=1144522 RepID=A0A1J4J490_9EUKA|nr:hypothetical protein TRFO_11763 [Tritrichomonas foetus]|eukprot:OHS93545.1 hypothetical protein TRFO_11763 [Tritrichomonas foetus]
MSYVDPSPSSKEEGQQCCNGLNKILVIVTLLVLCLCLSVPILSTSIMTQKELDKPRKETVVDRIISKIISNTKLVTLPTRYNVPDRYLLPPSDQASRGVCWAFATIFLLESQYRANGIEKGFLNSTEYVTFSKQAYAKYLFDKCLNNKDVSPCMHGGFGLEKRTTDDHKIDSIIYFLRGFPELANAIFPESLCEYKTTPDGEDICDPIEPANIEKTIKENPIEFSIKSFEAATNIQGAKRLLLEKQRPIGLGTPIPDYMFYAPCDSSNYSEWDDCKQKTTKCPAGFTSEYCHAVMVDSRIRDGTFVYLNDFSRVVYAGGHAVNIVGYNDDWVHKARVVSEKSMSELKGGFIIHNSWRAPGHSVEYLMGRMSEENEAVICPNHLSPMNWIPASYDCLVQNNGDYTKCGTEFQRVRGKGLTNQTDLLKCINTKYCDSNRNYVLGQINSKVYAEPLFNGLDRVQIISWPKDSTSVDNIKVDYIDYLPFWALKLIFEPVNVVENDPIQCGYWMYPYETTNIVNRKTWSLIDTFHVIDIEFEFPDSSYAANKIEGKSYKLIEESTHNFTRTEFDGPLPYQYVY